MKHMLLLYELFKQDTIRSRGCHFPPVLMDIKHTDEETHKWKLS